jgi:hypothetical protein
MRSQAVPSTSMHFAELLQATCDFEDFEMVSLIILHNRLHHQLPLTSEGGQQGSICQLHSVSESHMMQKSYSHIQRDMDSVTCTS